MKPHSDQPLSHRKMRDRALILPLAGAILLLPPVAGIFHINAKIAGIPFTALYLFAVWAVLIAGTAWLAPRLGADEPAAGGADSEDRGA